ncbi:MAG: glutamate racemase [Spirochaetes bacterium]|nr:glutamate racemase [Spirochaetota bacterium]
MTSPVKGSIVFISSGVGGLPYLECARTCISGRMLNYLADNAGFPYGTKTSRQIEDLLLERTRRLMARLLPAAIVIASNTASHVGLSILQRAHPDLPIVGTVPAIKVAAASTKSGRIGVIASERTIADPYIDDLIVRYAADAEVVKLAAQDLVYFVEKRFLGSDRAERAAAVETYVRTFVEAGVDRIVLACTHFLHLEEDFSACCLAFGAANVQIVDSRQEVLKRLAQLAHELGLDQEAEETDDDSEEGRFFLTGEPPFDTDYGRWARRFGLLPPERL